jgi:phosphoribosylaminoimidazolecarboxamide formyltransferase/IMP cyclohydrolase
VTSPDRYEKVLGDLREHAGSSCGKHRLKQAQRAFQHTAEYDSTIAHYLLKPAFGQADIPAHAQQVGFLLHKKQDLRYGENPHQTAALYVDRKPNEASVAHAEQLHGKELSYINLLDADGALSTVKEFQPPAACIVKHTTPCGCATADDLPTAFRLAYEGDPLAAFGGIVALNEPIDLATAQAITSIDKLLEVIVAPSYADGALALLRERWKNVRLLAVGPVDRIDPSEPHLHKIVGGWLIQQRDLLGVDDANWKVVSTRQPTAAEMRDLKFTWLVCKHVKSNAIAIGKDRMLLGAGAGQMDRVSAARLAIAKAGERVKAAVAASDAFFPFPDGPQLLLDAGVSAIIQPGGAQRDQETIDAVNRANAVMIFTGQRHFMH